MKFMQPATTKFSKPSKAPVFSKTPHALRTKPEAAPPGPKPEKRDNIFSKSRDTREDRGARQAKTKNNPQTLSHGR